jgi:hypothetical protein
MTIRQTEPVTKRHRVHGVSVSLKEKAFVVKGRNCLGGR